MIERGPIPTKWGRLQFGRLLCPKLRSCGLISDQKIPVWGTDGDVLVAGRADALAISDQGVDAAIDWKSDVNPTLAVRKAHAQQLRDYLSATHANRGAVVYLTSGEIVWVGNDDDD